MKPDFSHRYYRHMLQSALDDGREFLLFTEFDPVKHERVVILRHDIDLCLYSAAALARIEHEMGVRATYFIRLNSTFYNPFSQHEFPLLQEIVSLGHAIGLHFDPSFYEAQSIEMIEGIKREKTALSSMLGTDIEAISQHRPFSLGMQQQYDQPEFQYFAYHPRFTEDCKYISESSQRWREGDLIHHLPQHPRIQLLVHPVWWREQHMPWQECLQLIADNHCKYVSEKADILVGRYQDYLNKLAS
ncbi:MAG: hypothetical protein ACN2B6_10155 [Rickettsiales bacterium]